MLINAALKISCLAQTVTFDALTANGTAILPLIQEQLSAIDAKRTENQLMVEFSAPQQHLDEDRKLQSGNHF